MVVFVAGAAAIVVTSMGGGGKAAERVATAPSSTPTATPTATPTPAPTPIRFAGLLDGVAMSESEWNARKDLLPVAVMLDNTVDANPQAGLDKADVVYEAFVEGGITRFMAVYWRQEAAKILPVRSARTPFVVWARELGAMYAHAGSASTNNDANATGQIIEWGVKDLNAFAPISDGAYYRDPDRRGPHDLGTSTGDLREAGRQLGFNGPPAVQAWLYRSPGDPPLAGADAGGIEVDFQGSRAPWQLVQWKWDGVSRSYARFQFGGPHVDAVSSQQLHFTTVVVMETLLQVVDDSGHVLLDQLGSGKATVFMDGKAIQAVWKKADRTARTRLYASDGREIAFERGSTFIEVVGPSSKLSFTAKAEDLRPIPPYAPPPPGSVDETPAGDLPTPTPTTPPTRAPAVATATPVSSPTAPPRSATATSVPPTPAPTIRD
jgi:hypothetical protein